MAIEGGQSEAAALLAARDAIEAIAGMLAALHRRGLLVQFSVDAANGSFTMKVHRMVPVEVGNK